MHARRNKSHPGTLQPIRLGRKKKRRKARTFLSGVITDGQVYGHVPSAHPPRSRWVLGFAGIRRVLEVRWDAGRVGVHGMRFVGLADSATNLCYYPGPNRSGDGVLFSIDFFISFFLSFFRSLYRCFFVSNITRKRLDRFA